MMKKNAQMSLDETLNRQEVFWKEKARIRWHMDGDRNSKYVHRVTKIKNKTKMISSIRNEEEIITNPQRIANHFVDYFSNLFGTNTILQDHSLADEVIPKLIDEQTNNLLTSIPNKEEIKRAVFDLNSESAHGPYDFGAFFFKLTGTLFNMMSLQQLFNFLQTGWLLQNYNANSIILIPKSSNANTVDQFRPIALANFKFKIITKVIVDRLASILPKIISTEQKGFIRGRNIKDYILLASEAINMLDKKSYGSNLALKIDVTKVFDTLNWNFLLHVLKCFGFNQIFCKWISTILHSSTMSISINGTQNGYFKCPRGVRQGDSLSLILFCLAEEVLSRGIPKLVDEGNLSLMKATRHIQFPSHCFYADDLMVYCKGRMSNLQALKELFTRYASCSGQIINLRKSSIFHGGISPNRLHDIVDLLGFSIGSLPFSYLGAPIFKGKPKTIFFSTIC